MDVYQRLALDIDVRKLELLTKAMTAITQYKDALEQEHITGVIRELDAPLYLTPAVTEDWMNQLNMRFSRYYRMAEAVRNLDHQVFTKAMGHLTVISNMMMMLAEKSTSYKPRNRLTIM